MITHSEYLAAIKIVNDYENSLFNTTEERRCRFVESVWLMQEKYSENMMQEFISYWTESNPNGKKMRFEMQKVFDIKRRLKTWSKNSYGKKPNVSEQNADQFKRILNNQL